MRETFIAFALGLILLSTEIASAENSSVGNQARYCKQLARTIKSCRHQRYYRRHKRTCRRANENHFLTCSPAQLPPPPSTTSPTAQSDLACPGVLVCGQPPSPICPEGYVCAAVMPQPKLYADPCQLKADGAIELPMSACQLELLN